MNIEQHLWVSWKTRYSVKSTRNGNTPMVLFICLWKKPASYKKGIFVNGPNVGCCMSVSVMWLSPEEGHYNIQDDGID